jgi:Tfp pilus assembly protein PilV
MHCTSSTARGLALFDALIALAVAALGTLALAQVQSRLRLNADLSRQRAEAVRLAQADMEQWRSFNALDQTAAATGYAGIVGQAVPESIAGQADVNADFRLSRRVVESAAPAYKALEVRVAWTGRDGQPVDVTLRSLIAGAAPALAARLSAIRVARRGPHYRNPRVPVSALDLGTGRSGYAAPGDSAGYYVLDNADATVLEYCSGGLSAAGYAAIKSGSDRSHHCDARTGLGVSGRIGFDLREQLSAASPGSSVCDFYRDLASAGLLGVAAPTLTASATVGPPAPSALPVAIQAGACAALAPPNYLEARLATTGAGVQTECHSDARAAATSGLPAVNFFCVIHPLAPGAFAWSGHLDLWGPQGWLAGSPPRYTVCRYHDHDNDGSDSTLEHPAQYTGVAQSITDQNFLVIRGDRPCPSESIGAGSPAVVYYNTVQYQP